MPADEPRRVAAEDGHYAIHTWRNIMIIHWEKEATGPIAKRLSEVTESMLAAHPEGVSGTHIVSRKGGMPTAEARDEFTRNMDLYGTRFGCVGVVLEGRGFWASTLRSIIVGMHILSPRPFLLRIYEDLDGLMQWFPPEHERRTGVLVTPAELAEVIDKTRPGAKPG